MFMGRVCAISNRIQTYSDKLKSQFRYRWMATFVLACFHAIRVYLYGYCIVTFFMGAILSSVTALFLTSTIQPDLPVSSDATPILPVKASDELRPFVPFIPELRFWCIVNTILCVALSMTFIPKLNPQLPVPHLGCIYFGVWIIYTAIVVIDLRNVMKKYNFFPFYYGNKKQGEYKGK